jgi:hypothetical protein
MSRTMGWSAIVLVLACLTAGTAQALPPAQSRPEIAVPEVGSRLAAAWEQFVSLFRPADSKPESAIPSSSPQKGGCSTDPQGHCL